ncbi:SRPBCC family protein [Micromonospora deserti]|uniref:CBM2 domain-containing protein n=1 Tax=Micromonospora deserti TaxID=2070366 RepID=A0A2W2EC95_9ACTN|nr:SRPBCC family protein [Micromonospora deserti]PZG02444.1 hypothetical protein C1I99_02390 [Micromonospora deserti]
MIEIDAQVDVSHPADRVWRALTDPGLLARWFAEVVAGEPGWLLLHTAQLPGFDATVELEVIDYRAPELLVVRCQESGRRSRLTCAVTPTAEGSRVAVREELEHGSWPPDQGASREKCYQQALSGRLQAILDWLAFQQVDLRRGGFGMTAELPVVEPVAPASAGRRRGVLIGALVAAVLATGAAVWAVAPGEPERAAAPDPTLLPTATADEAGSSRATASSRPSRSATTTSARPSATPTAKPSPTPTSVAPPVAVLAARYKTVSTRLLGYTGEVVLDNRGSALVKDWRVVVTLAQGGLVVDAHGADWRQDGQAVTFTGRSVPAGQSRTFTFDVRDASPTKEPESCAVGGSPCAGL